jgi:PAS domain S-box-containing protein
MARPTPVAHLPPVLLRPSRASRMASSSQSPADSVPCDELIRLRRIVSLGSVGTWDWDLRADLLTWNLAHCRLFGLPDSLADAPVPLATFYAHVDPDDGARVGAALAAARSRGHEFAAEFRIVRADTGETRWLESRGTFFLEHGEAAHGAGVVMDITARKALEARVEREAEERRRLEEQLHQAQKMEAIGQLAGGVAHDFNNLLTVIMGNVEFARGLGVVGTGAKAELDEIDQASTRARTLVAQLLAFSRKQVVQIRTLDLPEVLRAADPLLRRVVGDEVRLDIDCGGDPLPIAADRGQLEQVLINLAGNARDAMRTPLHGCAGTGGTLHIRTRRVSSEGGETAWPRLVAGDYAELILRDTGHGMTAEVRDRIFEPFFTTKPLGEGTGLGLSQVVGIVDQCGGAISVQTAPGEGTEVRLRFPLQQTAPVGATTSPAEERERRGVQTILLVEDEPAVRRALSRMLESLGQRVLTAADGQEGLTLWTAHRDEISAIVTDVRMPHMNGRLMADLVRERAAALPIVFVSGYAADDTLVKSPRDYFVPKPLTSTGLVEAFASLGLEPPRRTPRLGSRAVSAP